MEGVEGDVWILTIKEGDSISNHLLKSKDISSELLTIGREVDEEELLCLWKNRYKGTRTLMVS